MTQNFYCNFLEYLSPKEKSVLLGHIQKHKVRIDGFRTIKDVPSRLLALHFSKNEKVLFDILKECYSTTYVDEEDAINNFSPDSAVTCFAYLIQVNKANETKLMSLMESNQIEIPTKNIVIADGKSKKKSDEFRKKYLTAYKELEQAKEQLRDLNEENQSLRIELESQKQRVTLLEKDVERSDKEHKEIVSSMQEKTDKLETECSRLSRITYMQSRKILVISNSLQQSFAGVMVLPYDRITELNHMVGDYSEILYVPNDMPFPSRRYIQKLDYIQEKLHVFCTHAELIDYLENGR